MLTFFLMKNLHLSKIIRKFAVEMMAWCCHNAYKEQEIMAQSAVTVRMDSEMKTQFDALCEQFGMSANTAFNIFVKAVIRSRSIPFTIKGTPSALDLFMQQRSAAELSKEPELSLDEVNAEIRAAREDIRKRKSAKV